MFVVLQQMLRLGQRAQRAAGVVALQRAQGALGVVQQGLGVGQACVPGVELVPFIVARRQLVHLGDLPLQAFALLLQRVLCGAGMEQGLLRLAPGLPQSGQGLRLHAGIGVEQAAHGVRPRQALPGMLAVYVQQMLAQGAHLRGRGRQAVDPGAALALQVYGAAQQQLVVREAGLIEPVGQCCGADVELGADVGALCPFADHAAVGACAQQQLQCVNQDGLARAGLAGEHGEARLQIQIQRLHDDEVAQRDAPQGHVQEPPSFQRSFLRRVEK